MLELWTMLLIRVVQVIDLCLKYRMISQMVFALTENITISLSLKDRLPSL